MDNYRAYYLLGPLNLTTGTMTEGFDFKSLVPNTGAGTE